MKLFSTLALAFALGLSLVSMDADAKRLGSGKSVGMQRTAPAQKAPDNTATAAPASAAAGTAAAAPGRSWMGPVAGIAAGLGLAALASYMGFGEEMATMLLIGLAVMAALAVIGFIMRKRAAQSAPRMAYAGAGANTQRTQAHDVLMPRTPAGAATGGGSMIGSGLAQPAIPADFDVAGFVRNAKVQFIRLQAANDAANLEDIRQFTTPEMFAELKMDIADRGAAAQATEVVRVDADVIEVAEEAARYVVSVRFTGEVREGTQGPLEPFNEIWHLEKPRAGSGGWVLAGIQQAN
jgi:predicted lipid-binding transport protein (Tim44 family)